MLFGLQDTGFANRLGLARFFKKLFHNVFCVSHRIVGPSAATGITHCSDLLKQYSSLRVLLYLMSVGSQPVIRRGLRLDSTATRYTGRGVPLWLHGPTYPGT